MPVKVVCTTCDKYSRLIPGFWHFFKKYWPECPYPLEVVAEKERPWLRDVPSCWYYGKDRNWSDNLITYLEQAKANIVILLLDDYYLSEQADAERLNALVALMSREGDIGYINLRPWSDDVLYQSETMFASWTLWQKVAGRPLVGEYDKEKAPYLLSLQPGIWRAEFLRRLLRRGEDGWQAEIKGTIRARAAGLKMMGVLGEFPLPYENITRYGEYRQDGGDARGFLVRELGEGHRIIQALDSMLKVRVV